MPTPEKLPRFSSKQQVIGWKCSCQTETPERRNQTHPGEGVQVPTGGPDRSRSEPSLMSPHQRGEMFQTRLVPPEAETQRPILVAKRSIATLHPESPDQDADVVTTLRQVCDDRETERARAVRPDRARHVGEQGAGRTEQQVRDAPSSKCGTHRRRATTSNRRTARHSPPPRSAIRSDTASRCRWPPRWPCCLARACRPPPGAG